MNHPGIPTFRACKAVGGPTKAIDYLADLCQLERINLNRFLYKDYPRVLVAMLGVFPQMYVKVLDFNTWEGRN
jgi:hypothetical protein